MSVPQFNLENAIAELRAAKVAKPAKEKSKPAPDPKRGADTLAALAGLAAGVADIAFLFEERAAIREHDGGVSRATAEAGAFNDCVARWRAQNPLPASQEVRCAVCGGSDPDTPVLAAQKGHAWLHRTCWPQMNSEREAQARAAVLAALREAAAAGLTSADANALRCSP